MRPGLLQSGQAERVGDRRQVVDVGIYGCQAQAHRDHRDMGTAGLAPGIGPELTRRRHRDD